MKQQCKHQHEPEEEPQRVTDCEFLESHRSRAYQEKQSDEPASHTVGKTIAEEKKKRRGAMKQQREHQRQVEE